MNCNALIKMKTTADSDTVAGARRQRPPREGRCAAGAGDSLRGRGAAGARRRRCRLGAVKVAEGRGPGTAREGGGGGVGGWKAAPGGVWDSDGEPRGRPAAGPRHVPGHPSRRATRTVRVVAARVGMTLRPSQSRRCIGDASEIIGDATWGFPVGQQPTGHQAARGKPRPGPRPAGAGRYARTHARTSPPTSSTTTSSYTPALKLLRAHLRPCLRGSARVRRRLRRSRPGDAARRIHALPYSPPPPKNSRRRTRTTPGPHHRPARTRPAGPASPHRPAPSGGSAGAGRVRIRARRASARARGQQGRPGPAPAPELIPDRIRFDLPRPSVPRRPPARLVRPGNRIMSESGNEFPQKCMTPSIVMLDCTPVSLFDREVCIHGCTLHGP